MKRIAIIALALAGCGREPEPYVYHREVRLNDPCEMKRGVFRLDDNGQREITVVEYWSDDRVVKTEGSFRPGPAYEDYQFEQSAGRMANGLDRDIPAFWETPSLHQHLINRRPHLPENVEWKDCTEILNRNQWDVVEGDNPNGRDHPAEIEP